MITYIVCGIVLLVVLFKIQRIDRHGPKIAQMLEEAKYFSLRKYAIPKRGHTEFFVGALIWHKIPILMWNRTIYPGGFTRGFSTIILPRLLSARLEYHLGELFKIKTNEVPLNVICHDGPEEIGCFNVEKSGDAPLLEEFRYEGIETDFKLVKEGKLTKTSVLAYGKPGNGKSYLLRYLACKYKLPIFLLDTSDRMTDTALIRQFNLLSKGMKAPFIVLLEDFDCYYDEKDSKGRAAFSLDTLLNVMDGTYYEPSGIIFYMTGNVLDRIDAAIKHRPSRAKFVLGLADPSEEVRRKIFGDDEYLIRETEGFSLDECLTVKERGIDSIKEISFIRQQQTNPVGFGA